MDYGSVDGPANGSLLHDDVPIVKGSTSMPITLTWENISYVIPQRKSGFTLEKESKTILNNVSGSVRPGQLLAIIGSTGAGKSSRKHEPTMSPSQTHASADKRAINSARCACSEVRTIMLSCFIFRRPRSATTACPPAPLSP